MGGGEGEFLQKSLIYTLPSVLILWGMENQVDFVRDKSLSLSWTLIPFENTEFDNTQRALNFHLRDGPTVYWPIVSIVAYYIKYK